jgi:hypothetical protein
MIWIFGKDRGVEDRIFFTTELEGIPAFCKAVSDIYQDSVEKFLSDYNFTELEKLEEKLLLHSS